MSEGNTHILFKFNLVEPQPIRYGIATDSKGYFNVFANRKADNLWTISLQSMSVVMLNDTGVFHDLAGSVRKVKPECFSFETMEAAIECFKSFYK